MRLISAAQGVGLSTSLLIGMIVLQSVDANAQEASDEATRQYAAAVRFQNLESYDLAAKTWQKLLDDFPNDPLAKKATHFLGICQYHLGQFDEALETFQKVVQNYPTMKEFDAALLYQGVTQFRLAQSGKKGMSQSASKTFDTLITKHPNSKHLADALFYSGECFYLQEKRPEAIDRYSQLIQDFPTHRYLPNALYAMGVAQEEREQFDAAGKTYVAFLKKFATHELAVEVGMRRGETLFAMDQFSKAAEYYAAASAYKNFPMVDYATIRRADAVAQLKQYDQAAILYTQLIRKFPKSEHVPRAHLAGGKCYYFHGDFETAQKMLIPVLDAGGKPALEAAHWIARSYLKKQNPVEALKVLTKVLPQVEESPFAAQLFIDQADATYEIPNRRADSIDLYATMAKKYPQDSEASYALYMAGYAALKVGDYRAATKHADAFLASHDKHPLTPDVMHVAAESRLLLEEQDAAGTIYAALLNEYPDHEDVQLWRVRYGLALHGQKKYQQSIDSLAQNVADIRDKNLQAEAQYLLGSSRYELKQNDQAVAALEASLAVAPRWRLADETLLMLARSVRRQEKLDEAIAILQRLMDEFPQSQILDRAHYRLGEYLYLTGDYSGAVNAYHQVVEKWPKSSFTPHALHELGCAELNRKQADEAEKALSQFVDHFAKHTLITRARYARAMARHQLGKLESAIEDLQVVLQAKDIGPLRSDARYVLGLCQMGLKQYDVATVTFDQLMREDPKYSNADNVAYQAAWSLKLSGQESKAVEQFGVLSKRFPDSPHAAESLFHEGESAYAAKEYQKAAIAYYSAMKKSGTGSLNEKAGHKLAWTYFHQNEFEKAVKTFRYQQKVYPKGALVDDAAFMEAECLFKQKRFSEALQKYHVVPTLKNRDFHALALLHAGQAARQLEQWTDCIAILEQCVKQYPKSHRVPEALCEQAFVYEKLNKPDQAIAFYEQVIAKTSEEVAARAQYMIGEIQFGKKQHADAVQSFFKVLYGYSYPTWQANAAFEAGRCFEILGKKTQAVKVYQELIEKFPKHDKVLAAKQRIQELKNR